MDITVDVTTYKAPTVVSHGRLYTVECPQGSRAVLIQTKGVDDIRCQQLFIRQMIIPIILISVAVIGILIYLVISWKMNQSTDQASNAVTSSQPILISNKNMIDETTTNAVNTSATTSNTSSPLDTIPTNASVLPPTQTSDPIDMLSSTSDVTWQMPAITPVTGSSATLSPNSIMQLVQSAYNLPSVLPQNTQSVQSQKITSVAVPPVVLTPIERSYKTNMVISKLNQQYSSPGSKAISLKCPNVDQGTYITKFGARTGNYLDALTVSCSDGSTIDYQGGSGGQVRNSFLSNDAQGFKRIGLKFGNHIDGIRIYDDSTSTPIQQYYGGNGGQYFEEVNCPSGQRLYGLTGNYENSINQLNIECVDINPTPI